ncbi:hypothetical protein EV361DRAFT_184326 [Lentinula raphanica]|nr:hypothetical protein EV361DRAFT_184326 [Lentinula raphanica]
MPPLSPGYHPRRFYQVSSASEYTRLDLLTSCDADYRWLPPSPSLSLLMLNLISLVVVCARPTDSINYFLDHRISVSASLFESCKSPTTYGFHTFSLPQLMGKLPLFHMTLKPLIDIPCDAIPSSRPNLINPIRRARRGLQRFNSVEPTIPS